METNIPFEIKYDFDGTVEVKEVIASLSASEELIRYVPIFLRDVFPNLEVSQKTFSLNDISAGSLANGFIVALSFEYQNEIGNTMIPFIEKLFSVDIPDDLHLIVSTIIILIILYIANLAIKYFRKKLLGNFLEKEKSPAPNLHIENSYNSSIIVAARDLSVTPENINDAIENVVGTSSTKSNRKLLQEFIRPVREKENGRISDGRVEISNKAIQEIPSYLEYEDDISLNDHYESAHIEIVGIDRIKRNYGWHVRLLDPAHSKERIPMKIAQSVNLQDLECKSISGANIIIEYKDDTKSEPKYVHLIDIENATLIND